MADDTGTIGASHEEITMNFAEANSKTKKLYKVAGLNKWLDRKIGKKKAKVYSFSILSGVDCPFAKLCKSKANVDDNGKRTIKDGVHTKFRCFSATQEVQYDDVYRTRKENHDIIHSYDTAGEMASSILSSIPEDAGVVRIHIAGDFFSEEYFRAWLMVSSMRPDVLFYAYTKSLKYWVRNRTWIPENLVLTASRGGADDAMIRRHKLRSAKVVFSKQEAEKYGLEIDDDDSTASDPTKRDQSFALLIHGTQPAGTKASKALQKLKRDGIMEKANKQLVVL
jgi:hypothetical protein